MINLNKLQKGDTIAVRLTNNLEHVGTITCIEPGVRIVLNTLLTNMQIPTHMIQYFTIIKKPTPMSAIEYFKTKQKLTNGCRSQELCKTCRINHALNTKSISCIEFEKQYPEQAIEIIKAWSEEKPTKTYLSVLQEKFPNTKLNKHNVPNKFCPNDIFNTTINNKDCIENNCTDCWNREYKED